MYQRILVALDGSEHSLAGGQIALAAARDSGGQILACHIYDVRIHSQRLTEMEPVLPDRYQSQEVLARIREAHAELIVEGFGALSRGYMDGFLQTARECGVTVEELHREGRNYVEILKAAEEWAADLLVLGALGLGAAAGDTLGSTAGRVLAGARCDVLIARRSPAAGRVVVGIDGSGEAGAALRTGAAWARMFARPLELVSVYDPFFHAQVFQTMSGALSPERQEEVGLAKQEALHEELVDEGLGRLYRTYLDEARGQCGVLGLQADATLLKGKAYRGLLGHTGNGDAGLIVVGRFGSHREEAARIGSNSEAAARLAKTNVLIAAPAEPATARETGAAPPVPANARRAKGAKAPAAPEAAAVPEALAWDEAARRRLAGIPFFVRPLARRAIEAHARAQGKTRVTLEEVQAAAGRMGRRMASEPDAE
jgi:nucleotide-binding universal stress UspA family protein